MTLPIPRLETPRLVLRAPGPQDFEPLAAFSASDRTAFVGGAADRIDAWTRLAALIGHWGIRGFGRWVLDAKDGAKRLGSAGLIHPEGRPAPEIAWTLWQPEAEGHGYAQEAATAARAYAYDTLGWTTAISLITVGNTRSTALAQRLGCQNEGVFDHMKYGKMDIWRHPGPA